MWEREQIKKNEMEGRGHVACVRERRVAFRVFGGERDHLEDLGVGGRKL